MNPDPQLPPPPASYRIMQAMMWPMLKLLGISCRATYKLCSEQMDRELSSRETLRLRFHLMMCGICRHLPAQFNSLRRLVRSVCEHDHEPESTSEEHLPPEAKARISQHLKDHPEPNSGHPHP